MRSCVLLGNGMLRKLLILMSLTTLLFFSCTRIIVNTGELEVRDTKGINIETQKPQEAADSTNAP